MHAAIPAERLARAKRAFSTRRAPDEALVRIGPATSGPEPGDLVLARVLSVGQHERLELTTSRRALLFEGDEIVLAYGHRYAPDQFEAEVPPDLGPCALAAAGGIAAQVINRHAKMVEPTRIQPLGLFLDETGAPLNLRRFAIPHASVRARLPAVAVVGGSMNAGKTTTAASIVRGLARAGFKPGAAKLTGTGAGNDFWHMSDAGAHAVLDFTDIGLATTYKAPRAAIVAGAEHLSAALAERGCDVLVFEIADGLFQEETAWLVGSSALTHLVDAYVYAAESAASAVLGYRWLSDHGRRVLGVSGLASASPLAAREVERAIGMPCLPKHVVASADMGRHWMRRLVEPACAAA